ncbi:MAG: putative holin-like toxin [Lactobacillus sp.]|nr:putative holin-like toxin [Lactobacillus sp.]MDE7050677.1 putative holin-like toxin [Lactobacillus sp.]
MDYISERFPVMSVYESISLMLLFSMFVLALLTYIDHHNK